LKELVSYRQWNMMDEFVLMNQVKEELCYVSNNVIAELEKAKYCSKASKAAIMFDMQGGPLRKNFVLPDFHQILRGYVKPDLEPYSQSEQLLVMETERFSVPELLFHPMDIGLRQVGVADAALQSLSAVESTLAEAAAGLVLSTGGNTKFFNFQERIRTELRAGLPSEYSLQVHQPEAPDHFVWESASKFVNEYQRGVHQSPFISRETYLEYGNDYCNRFFDCQW
jgi:actin-related protein 6